MAEFQKDKVSFLKLTVGDEAVPLLLLQIDEDHPVKSQLDSGGWRIGDAVFAFTEGQVSVAAGTVHPLTVNLLLDFLQVAGFSVPAHEKSFFRSFRMDKLDGSPLLHIQTQPDLERLVTQKNATHVIVSFRNSGRNRVPDGVETFYYKFNPVEVEFILGSTFISIANAQKKDCIDIRLYPTEIELDNYYFATKKEFCPNLSHETFFGILDFFSAFFQKSVTLTDSSIKWLNQCTLQGKLLAMVKGKTFYKRYGFTNPEFEAQLVLKGRENYTPTRQLLDEIAKNSLTQEENVRALANKIVSKSATVKEASTFFYELCYHQHPFTSSKEFRVVLKEFMDDPAFAVFYRNTFKKPVSTKRFSHKLSSTFSGKYRLEISVLPQGGKRTAKGKSSKKRDTMTRNGVRRKK